MQYRSGMRHRIIESLVAVVRPFEIIETLTRDKLCRHGFRLVSPREGPGRLRLRQSIDEHGVVSGGRAKPITQLGLAGIGVSAGIDGPLLPISDVFERQ